MRKLAFLIFIFLQIQSILAQETFEPLRQGGWTGGLSGNFGWDNYTENNQYDYDGYNFTISSRNGRFILDNFSLGFDFQWKYNTISQTSHVEIYNTFENITSNKMGFIGFWGRYYFIIPNSRFAFFPEASVGYAIYKTEMQFLNKDGSKYGEDRYKKADGLGYNIGLGTSLFVTNNIAFELTFRYEGGSLDGNQQEYCSCGTGNYEIVLSNIDILFGFQIYLR